MSKRTAKAQQDSTPQTAEERASQLRQIADRILNRIQYGACSPSERTQLLRQYDLIDRILQRHNAGGGEPDFTLLDQAFEEMKERYSSEAQ